MSSPNPIEAERGAPVDPMLPHLRLPFSEATWLETTSTSSKETVVSVGQKEATELRHEQPSTKLRFSTVEASPSRADTVISYSVSGSKPRISAKCARPSCADTGTVSPLRR